MSNNLPLILFAVISPFVCGDFTYETRFIQIPLDHFSYTSNYTFSLRYLYNETYFDNQTGPIFFYAGNEDEIEKFAQNTGFMWEIAPEFKALIIFAEHRYFGESLPFGNDSLSSLEKLGYLTTNQVLFDFVYLLDSLQNEFSGVHPVIAFGGSYGGMLATWLRMKYPNSVTGVVASSAPVLQVQDIVPCDIFNRITTEVFKDSGDGFDCSEVIETSWKEIRSVATSEDGKRWLSDVFKFCKPLETDEDVDVLVRWLEDAYGRLAMVDYPYATNFIGEVPAYPVREACRRLKDSERTLIEAIHSAISVFSNYTGQLECLDDSEIRLPAWDFQRCTEMVIPTCSTDEDMFETKDWDIFAFSEDCYQKWGVHTDARKALLLYGGENLSPYSNIVFTNGLRDPWSGGGVLKNISSTVISVLIPEAAHHLDLRSSEPEDPPSVIAARHLLKEHIQKWIQEF